MTIPSDISGMTHWWNPDNAASHTQGGTGAGFTQQMDDLIGSVDLVQATDANEPALVRAGPNGLMCLQHKVSSITALSATLTEAQPCEIWMAINMGVAGEQNYLFDSDGTLRFDTRAADKLQIIGNSTDDITDTAITKIIDINWLAIRLELDDADSQIWVDEVAQVASIGS